MGNEALGVPGTRKEALDQGSRFYRGAPCSQHPEAIRYTANARCIECCRAERRQGQEANRAKDAARKRLARERAKAANELASPAASIVLHLIGSNGANG